MATINFTWTKPTTREDGSELGAIDLTYKLYMDGELVVDDILQPNFSLIDAPEGKHDFQVTSFDGKYRLESNKSAAVTVNFTRPGAPGGLDFTIG